MFVIPIRLQFVLFPGAWGRFRLLLESLVLALPFFRNFQLRFDDRVPVIKISDQRRSVNMLRCACYAHFVSCFHVGRRCTLAQLLPMQVNATAKICAMFTQFRGFQLKYKEKHVAHRASG